MESLRVRGSASPPPRSLRTVDGRLGLPSPRTSTAGRRGTTAPHTGSMSPRGTGLGSPGTVGDRTRRRGGGGDADEHPPSVRREIERASIPQPHERGALGSGRGRPRDRDHGHPVLDQNGLPSGERPATRARAEAGELMLPGLARSQDHDSGLSEAVGQQDLPRAGDVLEGGGAREPGTAPLLARKGHRVQGAPPRYRRR